MTIVKSGQDFHGVHAKAAAERCDSAAAFWCSPALAVSVEPLADVMCDYSRYDGYKYASQDLCHGIHLLSVARLEKGSGAIIPDSDSPRNTRKGPAASRSGGALRCFLGRNYLLSTENI